MLSWRCLLEAEADAATRVCCQAEAANRGRRRVPLVYMLTHTRIHTRTHTHEHSENTLAGVHPVADSVTGAARRVGTAAVARLPCR